MKKWIGLLLLLIPCLAYASPSKVALLFEDRTLSVASSDKRLTAAEIVYQNEGLYYDPINIANQASYGGAGIADKDWFAARYKAVVLVSVDDPGNTASYWQKFRDAAGTPALANGPTSGTWTIPVYAATATGVIDTAGFVCGATAKSAWSGKGTWTSKAISRLRGVFPEDTLFWTQPRVAVLPSGHASTLACLVHIDTIATAAGGGASDTVTSLWRYKPGNGPGVLWTTLGGEVAAAGVGIAQANWPLSTYLVFIQALKTDTGMKPTSPVKLSIQWDHCHYSWFNPTDNLQDYDDSTITRLNLFFSVLDSLYGCGLRMRGALYSSPCEVSNLFIYRIRGHKNNQVANDLYDKGRLVWQIHSHQQSNCGGESDWTMFTVTDSARYRIMANEQVRCLISPDSGNYNPKAKNLLYIGAPGNRVNRFVATVLYDMGTRYIRGMDNLGVSSKGDWLLSTRTSRPLEIFLVRPGQGYIWTYSYVSLAVPDNATALKSPYGCLDDYRGQVFMSRFESLLANRGEVWTDVDPFLGSGNTADSYMTVLMGTSFRNWLRTFPDVFDFNGTTYQPRQPRMGY